MYKRQVYIQSESARVDDANNYSGYRDIAIPVNTEATITAIGVGSQAYPVKIVFKDTQGHSYYLEVALSRTNSGMDLNDFQGEKRMKYFSNAFSFTNKSLGTIESPVSYTHLTEDVLDQVHALVGDQPRDDPDEHRVAVLAQPQLLLQALLVYRLALKRAIPVVVHIEVLVARRIVEMGVDPV